ncbi:hypothetical protein ACJW31_04G084900 [Castanea mollissima]
MVYKNTHSHSQKEKKRNRKSYYTRNNYTHTQHNRYNLVANFLTDPKTKTKNMFLKAPEHGGSGAPRVSSQSSLFISVSAFMALCAKKAGRVSRKLKHKSGSFNRKIEQLGVLGSSTPLVSRPKELVTTLSNKAITFMNRKKVGEEEMSGGGAGGPNKDRHRELEEDDWGDGGVWQRSILMGDKCQPLDFSGVIYYDNNGRQLNEVPLKSPRASPLPGYLTRAVVNICVVEDFGVYVTCCVNERK